MGNELLTPKELAVKLRRHVNYVYAMRKAGFIMPGGLTTFGAALAWLVRHPNPRGGARKKR